MRRGSTQRLAAIDDDVAGTALLVGDGIRAATRALMDDDLSLAEWVIAEASLIQARTGRVADAVVTASTDRHATTDDARHLILALRLCAALEPMAASAAALAKIARSRYPDPAVPADVRGIVEDMGTAAGTLADMVVAAVPGASGVPLEQADQLTRELRLLSTEMTTIVRSGAWPHGVGQAVDLAGVSGLYCRFGEESRTALSLLSTR